MALLKKIKRMMTIMSVTGWCFSSVLRITVKLVGLYRY